MFKYCSRSVLPQQITRTCSVPLLYQIPVSHNYDSPHCVLHLRYCCFSVSCSSRRVCHRGCYVWSGLNKNELLCVALCCACRCSVLRGADAADDDDDLMLMLMLLMSDGILNRERERRQRREKKQKEGERKREYF